MSYSAQNLHPVAMLLSAQSAVRRWLSTFAFFGVASIANGLDLGDLFLLIMAVLIVVLGSAVQGFLAWRATRYWVDAGAFHLKQGVVSKSERSIPLDHIQSVDIVQGLLQRVFGVVEVRIETAGGGGGGRPGAADAALPAVSRAAASELQRALSAGRQAAQGAMSEAVEVPAGPKVIRRLGVGQLLLAGATSGQIGVVLPLLATFSQIFDDLLPVNVLEQVAESELPRSPAAILLGLVVLAVTAWLISISGTVLAYGGFTLSRDGESLRIRRGLLETREVTIPIRRLQAIRIVESVLRQPFGMATLQMDSAGYGANSGVSTTLFPMLPRRDVRTLLEAAAPEFAVDPELQPLPRRAARRYVVMQVLSVLFPAGILVALGVLPGLLGRTSGLLARLSPVFLVAAAGLIIASAIYGWAKYKGAGYALVSDCLVLRTRGFTRTTVIAPRRRLQSRSVTQNPFQKRAGLATFGVRVASGGGGTEYELPHVDAEAVGTLLARLGPAPRVA